MNKNLNQRIHVHDNTELISEKQNWKLIKMYARAIILLYMQERIYSKIMKLFIQLHK